MNSYHPGIIFTPPCDRGLNKSPMFDIAGCCNGLVLFYTWTSGLFRVFLCNPSTKICKELPEAELGKFYWARRVGSGWDEEDGSYKICVAMRPGICRVYSSETNSWKIVEHPAFDCYLYEGQSLRGKHTGEEVKDNVVFTFDLKSEVFGKIELPFTPAREEEYLLGELGGCLCIMPRWRPIVDIWVMKEYGVKESWLKLDTYSRVREFLPFSVRFVVGLNGEMMLVGGSTFLVYYPQDNVFDKAKGAPYRGYAHLCVETLVSPFEV